MRKTPLKIRRISRRTPERATSVFMAASLLSSCRFQRREVRRVAALPLGGWCCRIHCRKINTSDLLEPALGDRDQAVVPMVRSNRAHPAGGRWHRPPRCGHRATIPPAPPHLRAGFRQARGRDRQGRGASPLTTNRRRRATISEIRQFSVGVMCGGLSIFSQSRCVRDQTNLTCRRI